MNINKNSTLGLFLLCALPVKALMAHELPRIEKAHLIIKSNGVDRIKCSKKMLNCAITVTQDTGCLAQPGSISITNNSIITANNIAVSSSDPNFANYIIQNNGCPAALVPGASCTISFYTNAFVAFTLSNVTVQGTNTNATYFDMNAILCQAVLTSSVSDMALMVSGNARTFTITNTGSIPTSGLTVTYPSWPSGTTANSTCPSALAGGGGTCTITTTPGANATSGCNTGIQPTPGIITVSASNVATPIQSNVVVLNYGCIYQSGYIYSMDDTTPVTGSIGGKVAAQSDQSSSIIWSSNGAGSGSADVIYDTILGIDDTSTTGSPSPTAPAYPGGVPSYTACDGATDGSCDSGNIVSYYNYYRSTGGAAPTPLSDYAAGLCVATISGYSDWYLPSICELGPDSSNFICTSPPLASLEQNIVNNLSILRTGCAGAQCLAGVYWSSTEDSSSPQTSVWSQYIQSGSGSLQTLSSKNAMNLVRCSRALTS